MRTALAFFIVASFATSACADMLISTQHVGLLNVVEDVERGPGDPTAMIPVATSGAEGRSFEIGVDRIGDVQRYEGPDDPANPNGFFGGLNNEGTVLRYWISPAEGDEQIFAEVYGSLDASNSHGYVTTQIHGSGYPITALEFSLNRFDRFFVSNNDPEYPEDGYHRYEIEFTVQFFSVPEPSSLSMVGLPLLFVAMRRRRPFPADAMSH